MTEREWEDEGAGGEPAEAGVRWEAAGCLWAVWGFGWEVGVAISGDSNLEYCYDGSKVCFEEARSIILADGYTMAWCMPKAQQGCSYFDVRIPWSVRRYFF